MREARQVRPQRTTGPREHGAGRGCHAFGRVAAAFVAFALLSSGTACRKAESRDTLEVLVPFLPTSLDPLADSRLVSRSIFTAIYEPLTEETAEGIRPAIAESWTNPTPDSWVFRISSTSVFHDGTKVTSSDVFEAALASRAAQTTISGLADLKAIEVGDSRTVRFVMYRPAEDFLLTISGLFIPRRVGGHFYGTGPYRVVAHTPDRILLRRHSRPGRREPLLEEVVFRRFSSPEEGVRLLQRPIATAALDPTREMLASVSDDHRHRIVESDSRGLTYLAVGFSAGAGPLGDQRVRQALRLAIDLRRLAATGSIAGAVPVAQVIPPGAFGFDPHRAVPVRDLAQARRLLAAAGYPDGFDAVLDVNANGRAVGEILARQVAEAGIRLRIALHAPDAFKARIQGNSPLYIYSWFVGIDAGQALRSAFHTRDTARGLGTLNRTGFSDPDLDSDFAALAATATAAERLPKIRKIAARIEEELPWIPLFSAREVRIVPSWLELPLQRPDGLFVISEARRANGKS